METANKNKTGRIIERIQVMSLFSSRIAVCVVLIVVLTDNSASVGFGDITGGICLIRKIDVTN